MMIFSVIIIAENHKGYPVYSKKSEGKYLGIGGLLPQVEAENLRFLLRRRSSSVGGRAVQFDFSFNL